MYYIYKSYRIVIFLTKPGQAMPARTWRHTATPAAYPPGMKKPRGGAAGLDAAGRSRGLPRERPARDQEASYSLTSSSTSSRTGTIFSVLQALAPAKANPLSSLPFCAFISASEMQ